MIFITTFRCKNFEKFDIVILTNYRDGAHGIATCAWRQHVYTRINDTSSRPMTQRVSALMPELTFKQIDTILRIFFTFLNCHFAFSIDTILLRFSGS